MRTLKVRIERGGRMISVGVITEKNPMEAEFSYLPEYLERADSVPISLSLPLQTEAFSSEKTRNFFDGMLPEGFTRRSVAQWVRADEDDYLSILDSLGRECLGAIQIVEESAVPPEPEYRKLSMEEIRALAAEGASRSAEILKQTHLSLTGATGKVGLYYRKEEDAWYFPAGTAPSTHIVKQSHVRLKNIVLNEQLALRTAANAGLDVPESFIIDAGGGEDKDVLFATRRYDRIFGEMPRYANSMPMPMRLHQEDFAQALGIPASQKYERAGEDHMARMFDLLRRHSADPIRDMTRLWDQIVFNWLIGNTDAHVKNFSLLYSPDLRTLRLAPAYDLLGAAIYPTTRELSFRIGGAATLDAVTEASFEAAAREAGLGVRMAMQRYHRMVETFVPALRAASEALQAEGFPEAAELAEQILRTGGIAAE